MDKISNDGALPMQESGSVWKGQAVVLATFPTQCRTKRDQMHTNSYGESKFLLNNCSHRPLVMDETHLDEALHDLKGRFQHVLIPL